MRWRIWSHSPPLGRTCWEYLPGDTNFGSCLRIKPKWCGMWKSRADSRKVTTPSKQQQIAGVSKEVELHVMAQAGSAPAISRFHDGRVACYTGQRATIQLVANHIGQDGTQGESRKARMCGSRRVQPSPAACVAKACISNGPSA